MSQQIQIRRGTAALWTSTNPTLADAEIGFETDTGRAKVGDGVTAWTSLSYRFTGASAWGDITGTLSAQTDLQSALNAKQSLDAALTALAAGSDFVQFTGPTASIKAKTLRDAADTVLELGGSYTPTGTWTSMTLVTPALGTPASGVATNLTGTAAGLTAGAASAVAVGGITGLGTGVATALAVNVGSAGAFVAFNGALGTPSSGTATNLTGTASGLTAGNATLAASATVLATPRAIYGNDFDGSAALTQAIGPAFGGTGVANNAASTITISGNFATTLTVTGTTGLTLPTTGTLATLAEPETFSDKRITRRAPAVTQSATPTINTDVTDVVHITGLAQAITSMTTNLTGTPVEGDMLRIDFTDDGTGRAITWGAKFEGTLLPTTTVANTRLDVALVWNTVTSKWRCLGVS